MKLTREQLKEIRESMDSLIIELKHVRDNPSIVECMNIQQQPPTEEDDSVGICLHLKYKTPIPIGLRATRH